MVDIASAKLIMEGTIASATLEGCQVIRDTSTFRLIKEPEVVTEGKTGRKFTRLTGLIQKADTPNENGRVYPFGVMKEAIEALGPAIKERTVLGELDHPDDAKIHTENACLLLTKVWIEGKSVFGQFEILEGMPKGQMLKALIDQGVTISISSRGVGDMEVQLMEDGSEVNEVMPGFRFVCFDAVNEPSVKGTALNMMESRQRKQRNEFNERKMTAEKQLASAIKEFLK